MYFEDSADEHTIRQELDKLDTDLATMSFGRGKSDEALGVTWAAVKTHWLNVANQAEIERIINEADGVLKINPLLPEVISTRIQAACALHSKYLHTKITHDEVEVLFGYAEKVPNSESVRNAFFTMLDESEEAGKRRDYLTPDLIREAWQDAKYNPIKGSGIPGIDLHADLLREALMTQEPFVREGRKIGRNEFCPYGSGKKFKRCCMGKEIFD